MQSAATRTHRWALWLALAVLFQTGAPHLHAAAAADTSAALCAGSSSSDTSVDPADCPACRTAKQPRSAAAARARFDAVEPASRLGVCVTYVARPAQRFLRAPAPPRAPPCV